MIDTGGAIDNTYVGRRIATRLLATRYGTVIKPSSTVIYTPDKGAKPYQGEVDFDVAGLLTNERIKKMEAIALIKSFWLSFSI